MSLTKQAIAIVASTTTTSCTLLMALQVLWMACGLSRATRALDRRTHATREQCAKQCYGEAELLQKRGSRFGPVWARILVRGPTPVVVRETGPQRLGPVSGLFPSAQNKSSRSRKHGLGTGSTSSKPEYPSGNSKSPSTPWCHRPSSIDFVTCARDPGRPKSQSNVARDPIKP